MKYVEFKILYDKFNKLPLSKDVFTSAEYLKYVEAINDDPKVEEFFLKEELKKKKINFSKYCCKKLAYYVSVQNDFEAVIKYTKNKKFGIPVRDGGNSYIKIKHCPWCGNLLGAN